MGVGVGVRVLACRSEKLKLHSAFISIQRVSYKCMNLIWMAATLEAASRARRQAGGVRVLFFFSAEFFSCAKALNVLLLQHRPPFSFV